jgi:hypothetical protein
MFLLTKTMPNPGAFVHAFALQKGKPIDTCIIQKVKVGHTVVQQYQEYEFPLEIILQCADSKINSELVLKHLIEYTGQPKTVMSDYGNPYLCHIDKWTVTLTKRLNTLKGVELQITVTALGHGYRVRT